jgi:capsular polysaccharide biosynthesis protein
MIIDHHADQRLIKRVGMLRHHWLWILEAAVACAVGAAIVSFFQTKVYRATTYVLISESKIGASSRDSNLQQMAMLPTFLPFLDNDALVGETVKKFHLDEAPHRLTAERFRQRYLDVRIPKSTRLLELSIEFPDARLAADLANDIAAGAVRFNDRLNATDTTASREFLRRRLDEAEAGLLHAAERKLQAQQEARLEDREKDLAVMLGEKEALSSRLQELRMELVGNDVRTKALENALSLEPETILLKKSVISDRYLEQVTEKLDLAGPLAVTEESVNEIRESLRRDFLNVSISSAAQKTAVEAADARLTKVNREISQLVLLLVKLRSRISAADHEYTVASEAVRNANREYEAASVTVSSKSQDMKQIAPAMAPERPIRPNVLINAIAGFLFAVLIFGGGALAVQNYRDIQRQNVVAEREVKVLAAQGKG